MLLTHKSYIKVPALLHPKLNDLSYHIKNLIKNYGYKEYQEIADYFYEDFCEFISVFYVAFEKKQWNVTEKIVAQFYLKWLESSQFPDKLTATLEHAITAAITTLIVFHLSAQLAFITHYSLSMSCGFILLFIAVGIKVSTYEWSSVGILSGGLFKCKFYKSNGTLKNSRKIFKR